MLRDIFLYRAATPPHEEGNMPPEHATAPSPSNTHRSRLHNIGVTYGFFESGAFYKSRSLPYSLRRPADRKLQPRSHAGCLRHAPAVVYRDRLACALHEHRV